MSDVGGEYLLNYRLNLDAGNSEAEIQKIIADVEQAVDASLARMQEKGVGPARTGSIVGETLGGVERIQQQAATQGIAIPMPAALSNAGLTQIMNQFSGLGQDQFVRGLQQARERTLNATNTLNGVIEREKSLEEQAADYVAARVKALEFQIAKEEALAEDASRQVALAGEAEALRKERLAAERAQVNQLLGGPVRTSTAADSGYVENVGYSKAAEAERNLAIQAETNAILGEGYARQKAEVTLQQQALIETEKLHYAELQLDASRQELTLNTSLLELKAKRMVVEEQVKVALEQELYRQRQFAGTGPEFGPTRADIPREPTAPGGGGLGGALGNSIRYAAAGAVIFGLTRGVTDTVKAASQLQKEFSLIQEQFDALGDSTGFNNFKTGILEIARNTGISTVEVAQLARQIKGAFSNQSDSFVKDQVDASAKLLQVTGIPKEEITNDLVAISEAYGKSFTEIGDRAAGLGQRLGVESKEIIGALGDSAAIAQTAGLSFKEYSAVIGVVAEASGRGGSAIAESFGRIIPAVNQQAFAIVKLFQDAKAGDEIINKLLKDAAAGASGKLFLDALTNADALNKNQQNQFVALFGARQAFVPETAIQQLGRLRGELGQPDSADTGTLDKQFQKSIETLSGQLERLRESAKQVGIALYQSGLGTVFETAAKEADLLFGVLGKLLEAFAGLNKFTHGILGDIVAAGIALKVMAGLSGALEVGGTGIALGRRLRLGGEAGVGGGVLSKLFTPVAGLGAEGGALAGEGLLASAGAALATPAAIAVIGGIGVLAVKGIKDRVDRSADNLEKKLSALSDEEFAKAKATILAGHDPSTLSTYASHFFGDDTPKEIVGRVQQKRDVAKLDLPTKIGSLSDTTLTAAGKDPAFIDAVVNAYMGGEEVANGDHFRGQLVKQLATDPAAFRDKILKLLKSGDQTGVFEAQDALAALAAGALKDQVAGEIAGGTNKKSVQDSVDAFTQKDKDGNEQGVLQLQQVQQAYSAGDISLGEYISQLTVYKTIKDQAERFGLKNNDFLKQSIAAAKALSATVSKKLLDSTELSVSFHNITAGDDPTFERDSLVKLLEDASFTDPDQRASTAHKIADLSKKIIDTEASMATSAAEKIRILREGVKLPDDARIELLKEQIGSLNPLWATFLTATILPIMDVATFIQGTAKIAVTEGIGTVAAAKKFIEIQIAGVLAAEGALATVGGDAGSKDLADQYNRLKAALDAINSLPDFSVPGHVSDTTKAGQEEAAQNKDDPKNIALAGIAKRQALAAGDAVKQAQLDVERANVEAQYAHNQSDRLNAEADKIKAQRSLADALHDIFVSQIDVLIAVANASGDTIKAAELGVQKAKDAYQYAKDHGSGVSELNRLQAEIDNQTAGFRDTVLRQKEDDIQYQLDMKQITAGQAIGLYEQLNRIPYLTDQEHKEINRTIEGLKNQAGRDFQFNLPTEIGLPTLYEARRVNQVGGVGGYQDNRQISIVIEGSNLTPAQMTSAVTDALDRPSRYGVRPQIY